MVRGDLEDLQRNLKDSFLKIKQDFDDINQKISVFDLRLSDIEGRKQSQEIEEDKIRKIVEETIKSLIASGKLIQNGTKTSKSEERLIRKINRTKKYMIGNRIMALSKNKNMSLPEIRDILVHDEELCSRATFYRYFDKLLKSGKISIMKVNDNEIVVMMEEQDL